LRSCWKDIPRGEDSHHGDITLSPDGSTLASLFWSDVGDAVQLFDTRTGKLLHAFPAVAPRALAFSPDGVRLSVDSQNDLVV
jgi:WD40 repeat protein